MSWQVIWTPEIRSLARMRLENFSDNILHEIYAEWMASTPDEYGCYQLSGLNLDEYDYIMETKVFPPRDVMIDIVLEKACELSEASNGAWEIYLCPYGCSTHNLKLNLAD